MARNCPNCGTELPEEKKYCQKCGQEIKDAPKAAPSAASRPPRKESALDENVRQILSRYTARHIFTFVIVAAVSLTVIWLSYFRNMPMTSLEHFFVVFFYPVLAFLFLAYPAYYVIKVRKSLMNIGYTRECVDRVLEENPFWFKTYRPKGTEDRKKLIASGTVLSAIGWVIIACGVFAVALPVILLLQSGNPYADLTLAEIGALILMAGLLTLTAGKICKTLADRPCDEAR